MGSTTTRAPIILKNAEVVNVDTAMRVLSQVNLLVESNALAIDIGGSLAKLIYLQPHVPSSKNELRPLKIHRVDESISTALSVQVPVLNGVLHFFATETRNIHKLLKFIRSHWAHANPAHRHIRATGGGAYKYAQLFQREIDVTLAHLDEMKCTVAGLNFLLTSVDHEVYYYKNTQDPHAATPSIFPSLPNLSHSRHFVESTRSPFPYLLVNIGSGVSIVKVTDHDSYERVSGSSLGGGTFWGLSRLLFNCETFDDVINLTRKGNNSNVDMLVGDIYGGSYAGLGLDKAVIAASFGKATMRNTDISRNEVNASISLMRRIRRAAIGTAKLWGSVVAAIPILGDALRNVGLLPDALSVNVDAPMLSTIDNEQFRPQDVALSLLRMVSYNIAQIAHLNARVHGLNRIYFGGNFIRDHPYTIADISFAVDFWSGGQMKAMFLRHDGYLGAIGAFIGASSATPSKIIEQARWSAERIGVDLKENNVDKVDHNRKSPNAPHARNGTAPATNIVESDDNDQVSTVNEDERRSEESVDTAQEDETEEASEGQSMGSESHHVAAAASLPNGDKDHESVSSTGVRRRKRRNKAHKNGKTKRRNEGDAGDTIGAASRDSASPLPPRKANRLVSKTAEDVVKDDGGWTTVTRIRRKAGTDAEKQ